jgi:hypothetical protein
MHKGWFWLTLCHVVNPLTQICTLKLLKPCRSISGEFHLTKMLLRTFNRTVQGHTHFKTQKQSLNLEGLFLPPTTVPRCCSLWFPPLWSPKIYHPRENIWKSWRVYWRSGSTKFKLVQEGNRCSCFSLTQGC